MKPRPAVFFDRDGVLVDSPIRDGMAAAPAVAADMRIVPEAATLLPELRMAGFLLFVVTNQPDVARGSLPWEEVEAMNRILLDALPLDGIFVCPHDDRDRCSCRKPLPGLIYQATRGHAIDLPRSYLVGDRWRDIDAGHAAGCRTVWIDRRYREREPSAPPDSVVGNLSEAVRWILRDSGSEPILDRK